MALHTLQADTLLGEYRIIKLLGEGGFGLTYLAFDTNLEKYVAIKEYMPTEHAVRDSDSKIVPRSSSSEKTYNWGLNAFLNEAKTLAKFENPSIVRIYRFFKENGTAYIVMEYCEGGCLTDTLSKEKPMDENKLKSILNSLVKGLQLVHKEGILHRDIKPDNIMFRADGSAVLIDFGAARHAIGDKSRKVTTIISPGYAPLEQYSSKGKMGPWSDIYSLAAVAYLCITCRKPPDIMNRLHDDTIETLSNRLNSSLFLQAIDSGLLLKAEDRPKTLSEWSSLWDKTATLGKTHVIHNKKDADAQKQPYNNQFISARPEISTRDQTTLNTQTLNYNNPLKKISLLKRVLTLLFLLVFAAVSYLAYQHYFNKIALNKLLDIELVKNKIDNIFISKKELPITNIKSKPVQNNTPITENLKQSELILSAQKQLNELGYKVVENGIIDIRTQQSIKKFEQDNKLVITGVVDTILLNELKNKLKTNELENWNQALATNTEKAFRDFRVNFPNNQYNDDIENRIKNLIELNETIKKDNQQKEIVAQENAQKQRLINVSKEKKSLIKNIQSQLIRLKYSELTQTGDLDLQTKSLIKTYQKLKNLPQNGLPTKTLLFKLQSEIKWPGKRIGETFKACKNCPQMIVIKSGTFKMGDENGNSLIKPEHTVYVKEFSISQSPVTIAEWNACYANGFCTTKQDSKENNEKMTAVTNTSYQESLQFINWLKSLSGQNYQLPSEAQWEYASQSSKLNNPYQLTDSINSISEMMQDCWHPNYLGAPTDDSAWKHENCKSIVTRKKIIKTQLKRYNTRTPLDKTLQENSIGFRVVVNSSK